MIIASSGSATRQDTQNNRIRTATTTTAATMVLTRTPPTSMFQILSNRSDFNRAAAQTRDDDHPGVLRNRLTRVCGPREETLGAGPHFDDDLTEVFRRDGGGHPRQLPNHLNGHVLPTPCGRARPPWAELRSRS